MSKMQAHPHKPLNRQIFLVQSEIKPTTPFQTRWSSVKRNFNTYSRDHHSPQHAAEDSMMSGALNRPPFMSGALNNLALQTSGGGTLMPDVSDSPMEFEPTVEPTPFSVLKYAFTTSIKFPTLQGVLRILGWMASSLGDIPRRFTQRYFTPIHIGHITDITTGKRRIVEMQESYARTNGFKRMPGGWLSIPGNHDTINQGPRTPRQNSRLFHSNGLNLSSFTSPILNILSSPFSPFSLSFLTSTPCQIKESAQHSTQSEQHIGWREDESDESRMDRYDTLFAKYREENRGRLTNEDLIREGLVKPESGLPVKGRHLLRAVGPSARIAPQPQSQMRKPTRTFSEMIMQDCESLPPSIQAVASYTPPTPQSQQSNPTATREYPEWPLNSSKMSREERMARLRRAFNFPKDFLFETKVPDRERPVCDDPDCDDSDCEHPICEDMSELPDAPPQKVKKNVAFNDNFIGVRQPYPHQHALSGLTKEKLFCPGLAINQIPEKFQKIRPTVGLGHDGNVNEDDLDNSMVDQTPPRRFDKLNEQSPLPKRKIFSEAERKAQRKINQSLTDLLTEGLTRLDFEPSEAFIAKNKAIDAEIARHAAEDKAIEEERARKEAEEKAAEEEKERKVKKDAERKLQEKEEARKCKEEEEQKLKAAEEARERAEKAARQLEEQETTKAINELAIAYENRVSDLVKDLPEAWEDKIDAVMDITNMNAEVTTGSGSTLLRRDFATLVPSNQGSGALPWLNDEIVNMLFDRLVTAANEREGYNKSDSKAVPPYHAFNTNFYNTVSKRGPEAVARWSKRARIDKEKLLQCEQILIPLNPGGHWQLVIVSPKSKVIEFLCSLHLDGDTTFKHIHNWLKMELGSLYDEGDWFEVVKQSRQQANMSDCGVFTCFNGIGRVAGYDLAFDPKSMPWEGRRQLAAILLNGGFKGEFDYFHKESKDGA